MCPNPQETQEIADLVTFTEEILDGKLGKMWKNSNVQIRKILTLGGVKLFRRMFWQYEHSLIRKFKVFPGIMKLLISTLNRTKSQHFSKPVTDFT